MTQQGGHRMGIYFNPNHTDFDNAVNHSQIYVDKTELIQSLCS